MFAVIAVFVIAIVALGQPDAPSEEEKDTRANLLEFGEEADVETPPWANVRDPRNTLNTISGTWSNQGPGPSINGQIENVGPVDSATGFNRNEVTGAAHAVIAHPTNADILYVGGTNGGVWKTTNATAASPTWTPLTDDMPSNSIGALAFDSTDTTHNTVWAGIGNFSSYSSAGGLRTGLLRTTDAGSNWSVVNGGGSLNGKNISGLVVRGDTILAAVNHSDSNNLADMGLFRSTNGGSSFTPVSVGNGSGGTGLPGGLSYDIASNRNAPTVIYTVMNFASYLGGTNGIYRSSDTGATWSKVSTAEMDALIISGGGSGTNNVEIAVGNGGSVFVAIINSGQLRNGGIFYSATGNAGSFTKMDTVLVNEAGGSVGTNPRFKPNDGEPGGQGGIHFSIAVDPSNDQVVYIGGDRQPAGYQDLDGFPNSLGALDYSGRLFRGNAGIAATGAVPSPQWEHLTHTQGAGGMTGGGTASSSSPHADSREMAFDANGDLIETDDGGIYRRTSPGDNTGDWVSIIGTLQTTEQHDVAYDPISNVIMSGNQDTGSTQQSGTSSTEWVSILTADGGDIAIGLNPNNPSQSVRYSSFQNLGRFRRQVYDSANQLVADGNPSLDVLGGAEAMVPNFVNPVEINAIETNRLIFGASNGIYESVDEGATISKRTSGTISSSLGGNLMVYGGRRNNIDNPDFIFAALAWTEADPNADKKVIIRTSAGGSFTEYLTPADTSLRGVTADPEDWNRLFVIDRNQVFMSTDAGANWIDITGDLPDGFTTTDLRVLDFVRAGDRGALLVGGINGVYAALDTNYSSWAKLGTDLPIVPVWDLDYDPTDNVLVAGTLGRGSWKMIDVSQSLFNIALPEYTVTPSAGANGSIEPSTAVTVEQGSSYSFTITPDAGYQTITPVGGTCGGTLVNTTYTTEGVTAPCTVEASFETIPPTLGEALDAPSLTWITGGSADWEGQTAEFHPVGDNNDAAQSGDIEDNQSTYIETTVAGPGTISFYWKVSSESDYDFLRFFVDGLEVEEVPAISGVVGWTQVTYEITGEGNYPLRWAFVKDYIYSSNADAAWVDLVTWTTATTPNAPTLISVETEQTASTTGSATVSFSPAASGPVADSYVATCAPQSATRQVASEVRLTGDVPTEAEFAALASSPSKAETDALRALHESEAFRASGGRCGTPPISARAQPRSTSDCSFAGTTINSSYNALVGSDYVVPVVFHVIHKSDNTGLLTPQQIENQMAVLNEDFAGFTGDYVKNGSIISGGQGVSTSIRFDLVEIKYWEDNEWFTDAGANAPSEFKSTIINNPAYNTTEYLNVYTNDAGASLGPDFAALGYATLPAGSAGGVSDGIVMLHSTIGGRDNGYGNYNQGRTLVHEVGHYLGLEHTFYPNGYCDLPNDYTHGDLIADTPAQQNPDFDSAPSSDCGSPSAIENFMNYSIDDAMFTFSEEQTNRMICSLQNYRSTAYEIVSDGPTAVTVTATGANSPIVVPDLLAGTTYQCSVAAVAGSQESASSSSGTIMAGDADGDGVLDYDDAFPNDPTETTDTDGEGLGDNLEGTLGTDPENPDTDGDGYTDYEEYVDGTDPLDDGDPGSGGLPIWLLYQATQ